MDVPQLVLDQRRDAVARQEESYDAEERMIVRYFGDAYNYNYFTRNANAHPTRETLRYAVELLDTYDDARLARAEEVIRRVMGIQDADPESPHYGVWPHLMEEPLGQGPYVDRNWADFLGKDLLHVMIYHRERLPGLLVDEVEASLRRAVEAIRRRNVGPGYTNIAVMSAYVTLVSGETFKDSTLVERGVQRVCDLHAHVQDNGTFTEYNSPTYTMVALRDLATFRHHVRHADARPMVEALYRLAWEVVTNHFHPPTGQWAGPNSRSYLALGTDAGKRYHGTLRTIEEWTSPAVDFGLGTLHQEPEWACLDARCPLDLEPLLVSIDEPRQIVERVVKRPVLSHVATTYLDAEVTLGSINHQDTWNQRRNVLAYWGDSEHPSCLKVRLIYDGYDLSTGAIWTRQDGRRVLGAVTFATDGGGKHLSLDRLEDGRFEASELSLRFELSGAAGSTELPSPSRLEEPLAFTSEGLAVRIQVPFAVFDDCDVHWETGKGDEGAYLDVSLHRGESREFRLKETQRAAVAFALQMGGEPLSPATASAEGQMLEVSWHGLGFSVPVRPATYAEMREAAVGLDAQ